MYEINNRQTTVMAKLTSKNQLTLPKTVRDVLRVGSADMVEFRIDETGQVTLRRSENDLWSELHEQAAKYGNPSTPEIDWGTDVESEDFD